jgi:hypothetical protein
MRREDVHVVSPREALDEPQERWYDAIHATPVYAAGKDNGDLHAATSRLDMA